MGRPANKSKSELFGGCPSIITGKHKEETKAYYFENREQPGTNINFFAGNAPCGNGSQENTLKNYELEHGTVVHLTEDMANHVKSKGRQRPITEENDRGEVIHTGKYFNDSRFSLHEA